MNNRLHSHLKSVLKIVLLLSMSGVQAEPANQAAKADTKEQEKAQAIPMLAKVPTYDEQALTAKLLANAVSKEETLSNQHNLLTLRQLEAQNEHTSGLLKLEKLALERSKLALEQFRLTQQQQMVEQDTQHSKAGLAQEKKRRQYQQIANIRLASIITLPSGGSKAIFYQDDNRQTYLEGDQIFTGAQLLKIATNGVAIKLNEEVIFKYLN